MENDDTQQGGESLSIDQAAAAFVKATAPEAIRKDDAKGTEQTEGDDTTDEELQTSDEDASEEDDGESASDDDADESDDDESDPQSEQGRFVADNAKVRLPDGTITTVQELKRGNLREADYTRKRQEEAALHNETVSQSERIKQREQQINEQAKYVTSLIQSIVPPAPDPSMADPNSPNFDIVKYLAAEASHKQWSAHLNYLTSEQQKAQEAAAEETRSGRKATADKEWASLLTKVPEFKDEKRVKAFVDQSFSAGEAYGFSKQEIAEAIGLDHRQALVLKDAMAWRRLQASKSTVAKKVEGRPPIQKGGKRLNPSEHRARSANDALTRLKDTGSEADAVAAYLASTRKG